MSNYAGYGSPEKLEQAIRAEEGPDFIVHEALCFATVCSDLPQEEVEARMHRRPCGTRTGWAFSEAEFSPGIPNPCPCKDNPDTHKHYLFSA